MKEIKCSKKKSIIIIQKDLKYSLNLEEMTAEIIGYQYPNLDNYIPQYIKYNNGKYIIVSILTRSFQNSHIKSLHFDGNSKLKKIEKNVFDCSKIETLSIPSSIEKFEEGWCTNVCNLKNINVIQNKKQNIQLFDNKYIIGKSNQKSDIFDVLIFARRDMKIVVIPSFIKKISPFAFADCKQLEQVEIPKNSELQIIGNDSFTRSSIKSIVIPDHVKEIGDQAFSYCEEFTNIEISKYSQLQIFGQKALQQTKVKQIVLPTSIRDLKEGFAYESSLCTQFFFYQMKNKEKNVITHEGNFILKKSDPKSDKYDILLFARPNIKVAKIPTFIKRIGSFAFANCGYLEQVDIPEDSELETIGENAFSDTSLHSFKVPIHLTCIEKSAFHFCRNLKQIIIPENSELRVIGNGAFYNSEIMSFDAPPHLTEIDDFAFYCRNLLRFRIPQNSELKKIGQSAFDSTYFQSIFIPKHVTEIKTQTFSNCLVLGHIKIPTNTNLRLIESFAFFNTQIKSLSIPSNIKLHDFWCDNTPMLTEIKIIPKDEQNIIYHHNKILIGKSNPDNEIYDVLLFARRDIKNISIPSFIKRIAPVSFHLCEKLESVEIPANSDLEIIDNGAFRTSSVRSIFIPAKVKEILQYAFSNSKITKVDIALNSELKIINCEAFSYSSIQSFIIPSSIQQIGMNSFSSKSIKLIEFEENTNFESINTDNFSVSHQQNQNNSFIMIPPDMKKLLYR